MLIPQGWYKAECSSIEFPKARIDEDSTFFLPFDIQVKEGIYSYFEYRFNLPVTYQLPSEVIEQLSIQFILLQNKK